MVLNSLPTERGEYNDDTAMSAAFRRRGSSLDDNRRLDTSLRNVMFLEMRRLAKVKYDEASSDTTPSHYSFRNDGFDDNMFPDYSFTAVGKGKDAASRFLQGVSLTNSLVRVAVLYHVYL
jgi:hypothetical protein